MTRLLLISPNSPIPPDMGAAQRTFLLYESLRRVAEVDLLIVNDDPFDEDQLQALRSHFNLVAKIPRTDPTALDLEPVFRLPIVGTPLRWAWRLWLGAGVTLRARPSSAATLTRIVSQRRYRAIVSRYLWPACQTDAFAHLPVHIDFDDLDSEVYKSQASVARGLRKRSARLLDWVANAYHRQELREAARCAGAWVTKAKDVGALGAARVSVLPNIPFAAYPSGVQQLDPPPSDALVVLGVAAFDWPPNRSGFDWFVMNVWPQVRAAVPSARLDLVGKASDPELVERWNRQPGVHCLGRVDDLRACYEQALFTVAPLFLGGGTNIKVIESLAFGRCCIVSSHASKGFDELPGLHVAQDADDFAALCRRLLEDHASTAAAGREAAVVARKRYSFDRFAEVVASTVGRPSR